MHVNEEKTENCLYFTLKYFNNSCCTKQFVLEWLLVESAAFSDRIDQNKLKISSQLL